MSVSNLPQHIAITGSNGWIGSALRERLEAQSYLIEGIPHQNAQASGMPPGLRSLVHLAALVHQIDRRCSFDDYLKANCDFAVSTALKAAAAGCRQMIFVSTAKVMGERSTEPLTEGHSPQPSDDYGKSKWQAEQALFELHKAGDLGTMQITVLRPPLVFGQGAGANYARLERLAASSWPLPLGQASAPRSMVSLDRLTQTIAQLIQHRDHLPPFETFFITEPSDNSVADLITQLRAEKGRSPHLFSVPRSVMKTGFKLLGKSAIYERLFTPLQVDGGKLRRFLAEQAQTE